MKRIPVRDILSLFVITRLFLIVLTYIAYILLTAPKYSSTPVNIHALLTTWNHWDAANYVRIAEHGYLPFDIAFFPLFPFLISAISHLLGGESWSYLLVGTLISNMALLGTLFILYQLVADNMGDEIARRALHYLCIFPTAFFFFAAYNESLYLLFVTGTFLALQHKRWWLAGLLGLFAALTRNAGIWLVIPYLYELWVQRHTLTARFRTLATSALPIVLIPIGIAIFALYCWKFFGNPLAFVAVQQHAGRHLAWPWTGILRSLSDLFFHYAFGSSNEAHVLLNLCATLGFILLIILGWNRLPGKYTLWMVICFIHILLYPALDKPDALLSNQRFVLELFPAFITMALLGKQRPWLHQALTILFSALLAILSIAFLMNRWMV